MVFKKHLSENAKTGCNFFSHPTIFLQFFLVALGTYYDALVVFSFGNLFFHRFRFKMYKCPLLCMECLYSLYGLSLQFWSGGNSYKCFLFDISKILLSLRYWCNYWSSSYKQSILEYLLFLVRMLCYFFIKGFPLVLWIVSTSPYIYTIFQEHILHK